MENRRSVPPENSIPNRPTTGSLSVLARIPHAKSNDNKDEVESIQPVYVGEFPQVVRDEQANILQRRVSGDAGISGGMDKGTSLAWIICGSRLFIWSYLSRAASSNCVVLDIPLDAFEYGDVSKSNGWILCVVDNTDWDEMLRSSDKFVQQRYNASILLCNKKTRALIYWPDIYPEDTITQVTYFSESAASSFTGDNRTPLSKQLQGGRTVTVATGSSSFNSLIVSCIPHKQKECIALATCSNGQLWQFHCGCASIKLVNVNKNIAAVTSQRSDSGQLLGSKGYPRSLTWHFPYQSFGELKRQFLLLTDHEIQCFSVSLSPDFDLIKLWSHEIISSDGDFGIQKGLAGQKKIWPLDLQIDSNGKVITVLIATFCKDRATSSNYTEYSLLTMQYKSGLNIPLESNNQVHEKILEKKAPIQVIIPKARVEDEDFLFSMRLKVGGKPSESSIVLSGDGTATVTHYWRNSIRPYQFDLPYDAGKVVDASVFPSDDGEDGAWAVLTEKAGVWAIPEKAVLLGGVEPPERSLSRKGSSNEGSAQERRNFSFAGNIAPRRASSEAWDAGETQISVFTGIARRTAQDEESEALLAHLFHDFLSTGQATGVLDKLKNSGAFERDGEINVFARVSKSIVDTLAKHWTTTRDTEIVALSVVSTQLLDKQQKHKKFLQFLALSKCHEELCSRQRQSLQIIMEHGQKLAGMIQLRELQNMIRQQVSRGVDSYSTSETVLSGPLWDLIQFVGERARQNTVLLMDRDNAEVFYSKVSELEEVFHCLERQMKFIISEEMPLKVQLQRACELSNACATLLRTAMQYKNENHMWYPSPEGLTPWYCQTVVRSGLWSVASFMLNRSDEASSLDRSASLDFHTHLEVLTELVLEAHSGAITAKVERQEDNKCLSAEYSDRRDTLLNSLYQQAKGFLQSRYQDSSEATEEQNVEIFRELSSKLLSIAKRHEGYQTLWNLCCDLNNTALLRSLMHDRMGPRGGFSCFVFKQMYASKQLSKLRRLGEEFPEDFATFSKQHPETLHSLSLSEGDSSISESEDSGFYGNKTEPTLADRKRLLNLSKKAVMAEPEMTLPVYPELSNCNLPGDVVNLIMLHLHVKTLLRWLTICREWFFHCLSPKFQKEFNTYKELIIIQHKFKDNNCLTDFGCKLGNREFPPKDIKSRMLIVGTTYGVVCIADPPLTIRIEVWNPATQVSLKIPLFNEVQFGSLGFTYDRSTDEPKVIMIGCVEGRAYIYSTRSSKQWVEIQRDFEFYVTNSWSEINVNGCPYWYAESEESSTARKEVFFLVKHDVLNGVFRKYPRLLIDSSSEHGQHLVDLEGSLGLLIHWIGTEQHI